MDKVVPENKLIQCWLCLYDSYWYNNGMEIRNPHTKMRFMCEISKELKQRITDIFHLQKMNI